MSLLPPAIATGASPRDVIAEDAAAAAMIAIAERHGWAHATLAPTASGSDLVHILDGRIVVKLTAPQWADEISNEVHHLVQLEGALSVQTPRVVATGELEGWPYVAMTRIDGLPIARVWPALDGMERRALAEQIGVVMAQLHRTPVLDRDGSGWTGFVQAQVSGAIEAHRRRGTSDAWLEALAPRLACAGESLAGPVVSLHTELLDEHIFVDNESGQWRVSGLIDFADAMQGGARYDVAALVEFLFKGEPGILEACLAGADWPATLDEAESSALLDAALLHRFASLPRMLAAVGWDEQRDGVDLAALRRRLHGVSG